MKKLFHSAVSEPAEFEHEPVPRRSMGLRTRWTITSAGAVLLVAGLCIILFLALTTSSLYSTVRADLVSRVNVASSFLSTYASSSDEELYFAARRYIEGYTDRQLVEMQFLSSDGTMAYSTSTTVSGGKIETQDVTDSLEDRMPAVWYGKNPASGEWIMAVSEPVYGADGSVIAVVRCLSSLKVVNQRLFTYAGVGVLISLVFVLFVTVANAYFIKAVMTPLQQINDTAQLVAEGRYGVHIEQEYTGEIGELCTTINNMSDAISRAEKTKNEFISSVSHELRTPLTAISGWSETLLAGSINDAGEVQKGLTIIHNEAARLTRLVEEMLDLSRMENAAITMRMEKTDIAPEIEDVVFMYMDFLKKEDIRLDFNEEEDLPLVICDKNRIKQVFFNLLDNALKHGGEGKRIIINVSADVSALYISVRDFGAGIPPTELPRVKDKFYKGSSKARGSGIGLAVADEIMKLHGGRLDIDSLVGDGTTVTMTIPIATQEGNPRI